MKMALNDFKKKKPKSSAIVEMQASKLHEDAQ